MSHLSRHIATEVKRLEMRGLPATPDAVMAKMPFWAAQQRELQEAWRRDCKRQIVRWFKRHGYVLGNFSTHERVAFATATIQELEEQLLIDDDNEFSVHRHKLALKRVILYLKQKEAMLGRSVEPQEFQGQIERIYARSKLPSPFS